MGGRSPGGRKERETRKNRDYFGKVEGKIGSKNVG